MERVLARVDELTGELLDRRRDLHAHPELSWHEERTTELVSKRLAEAGLVVRPLGSTGVMADVGSGTGGDRGPVIALRSSSAVIGPTRTWRRSSSATISG